jgi:hypothetical protein
MSVLDSVLAQYEKTKNAASGSANKVSQEDRMKKYFTTILPKGVRSVEKRIRILPPADGGTPFVPVKFHEIQVDGQWTKLYDPAQEGKRSPLNEVYESLMMTGVQEDRDLARSYRSRGFYIVKVIDRDNEQDGPKFWRFKHNTKADGVLDKIHPIFRTKGDVTDVEKGRDLILTLSLTKAGNGKEYTTISSVIPDDPSPLHTDPSIAQQWTNDELTWADVYSKKGEDYLEMVARGEVPRWDSEAKKFVSNSTGEATIGASTPSTPSTPSVTYTDPQDEEESNDDLPF